MVLSERYAISPQAIARTVGDETVILDLERGLYFGLDQIGARVWKLIGEGKALSEICAAMLEEYDVSQDQLERDIIVLVRSLSEHGLISPGATT